MRNEIDKELGNWDKDATNVKHKIYDTTIDSKVKRRLFNCKPIVAIVATLFLVVSAYIMWPTLTGEQTNQADNNETPPAPIIDSSEIRKPDQLTIDITKYHLFYYETMHRNEKEAELYAIFDVLEWYELINYMEEYGVVWPEYRREYYRERSKAELIELKKKDTFQKFYTILQTDLGITDEDYIEYLLVQYEYQRLQEIMFSDRVGLTEDGGYPSGLVEEKYGDKMGISEKRMNELAEEIEKIQMAKREIIEIEPPTDFPEGVDYEFERIGLNEHNEYIFIDPDYLDSKYLYLLSYDSNKAVYDITRGFYQDVTRMNILDYLQYLNEYEANDEEEKKAVQDLIFITEMIIQSIELTMEGSNE